MTKKNKFIVALSTCAVSCLALAFTFMPKTEASAAIDAATVNTIAMQNGASVRLKKSNPQAGDVTAELTGIRFTMFLNKDYYDSLTVVEQSETVLPEVGMYIAIADTVAEGANLCTEEAFTSATYRFVKAQAFAGDSDLTTDETISFNVVLYDIPVVAYNEPLVANGYIVDGSGNKVFANNPITRSVAQVASVELAEGGTGAGLTDYVDNVVTADNFKIANTDIVTDLYKTETSIDLGAVLPENLTAIWESSDPEVAAVDASGNVTRGSKVGETTITATLGTVTRTAKITVNAEPAPVIVTSTHYTNITNTETSLRPTFVTKDEWTAAGVTGSYTGNAAVMNQSVNNPNYRIINQYTDAELDAIAEDYDTVSMWIAVYVPTGFVNYYHLDGGAGNTFVATAFGGTRSASALGDSAWKKISVTLTEYRAMLKTDGDVSYCPLARTYQENATGALVYVGDVTFEKSATDDILIINENNYMNVHTNIPYSYVTAAEIATLNIEGEYSGNATRFNITNALSNSGYTLRNKYSQAELTALKETYNTVSVYMAMTGVLSSSMAVNTGVDGFASTAAKNKAMTSFGTTAKWQKVSISMDEYIALVATSNYVSCPLIALTNWNAPQVDTTNGVYFFVGDVLLEYVAPTIITVNDSTYTSISNTDTGRAYSSKADWESAGVSGEAVGYTGNATRFVGCSNQGFKIANPYTEEELLQIAEKYDSVSMYFAIGGLQSGTLYYYSTGFEGLYQPGETKYNATNANINVWQKWTISIADYITLVAANDYTYFKPWTDMWGYNVSGTFYYYFGDVIFE